MRNRLTQSDVSAAQDLCDLLSEVVTETREADNASLSMDKKLRIKLRAIEIGLRVIEITNHERRISALEERANEPT